MRKVTLLNPKGGCGKTTIATNLASHYARKRHCTVLIDHDAQGSSTRWLALRSADLLPIQGIAAFKSVAGVTRTWQLRVAPDTEHVIVDTPAGLKGSQLIDAIRGTDAVIVPVLPSHIDRDAASDFIEELLHIPQVRAGQTRVAVVANRVKANTLESRELETFVRGLGVPCIGRLHDTQAYARAGARGEGIWELRRSEAQRERRRWAPLLEWLSDRCAVPSARFHHLRVPTVPV